MNPITHCLDRLHLSDDYKLKRKAEEFQGQMSSIPNKIFDKGPILKPVISIHLAYESLKNYDWDIKLAAQLAGCTASAYESVLSIVRQRLNLQPVVTLEMLAVALGSTTMLSHANDLWQDFIINYTSKLSGAAQKRNAQKELEQSCWKGAIMFTCAKAFGKTMEKEQLHKLCGCSTAQLSKSIKIVSSTSEKKILALKNESTTTARPSRKRRATTHEEEESDEEMEEKEQEKDKTSSKKASTATKGNASKKRKTSEMTTTTTKKVVKPISGIVSMIDHMDYKKTKTFRDYEKWRSNLVSEFSKT